MSLFVDILQGLLIGGAVGAVLSLTVYAILDAKTVREEVKRKCPSALKAEIMAKKENAVKVGIFENEDEVANTLEITSTKGVSENLYVGQVIYL